jgi:hypothetical protein
MLEDLVLCPPESFITALSGMQPISGLQNSFLKYFEVIFIEEKKAAC